MTDNASTHYLNCCNLLIWCLLMATSIYCKMVAEVTSSTQSPLSIPAELNVERSVISDKELLRIGKLPGGAVTSRPRQLLCTGSTFSHQASLCDTPPSQVPVKSRVPTHTGRRRTVVPQTGGRERDGRVPGTHLAICAAT